MGKGWLAIFLSALLWSAIKPKDYFTWVLEVAPALVALVLLQATKNRFRFTPLAYILLLMHSIILMVGGHYTYAEVPLFHRLKDAFDWGRNNYDKVGHFAQGFIPAIVAREIIIRNRIVHSERWTIFFVVCISLSISAFYELIEWWVAIMVGESADAFLGTQGYVWDTQSDMALALLGSILSIVLLRKLHDRQMRALYRQNTSMEAKIQDSHTHRNELLDGQR